MFMSKNWGKANKAGVMVRVCDRTLSQEEEAEKIFSK